MMKENIERIKQAKYLPDEWDELAELYFQQRAFLHYTDMFNSCNQRYYLLWQQGKLIAGACV